MGNFFSIYDRLTLDPFPSLDDPRYHILTPSIGKFLKCHTFALIHACEVGNYELVHFLLTLPDPAAVDVMAKNYLGRDALMTICFHGYRPAALKIINLLLQHGAKPTQSDLHGCTCLMDAAGGGHINLVELLLRHGADINAKDNDGTSVLMYACSSGSLELVKYLIMEGAKFWENDAFGCSSIQYALSCGSPHGSLISQYISGLTEKVQSISDTSDQTTSSDQTTGSSSTASGSDCQSGSESPTLSISDSSSPVFEEK